MIQQIATTRIIIANIIRVNKTKCREKQRRRRSIKITATSATTTIIETTIIILIKIMKTLISKKNNYSWTPKISKTAIKLAL